ncbi:MAG: hypothetical protein IKI97_14570 [Clostridia bacterium]|nr:hypothetical protein [Clostridia bacterium]
MKKLFISKEHSVHFVLLFKRLLFCLAVVLAFMFFQHYISRNAEYEYTGTEKKVISSGTVAEKECSLYTLRLENGSLSVYAPDGSFEYTVDIDTELLTEYDRELLSKGISVAKDELSQLIGELDS